MPTEAGFDPGDFSGFTEAHLEVMERFRDVAVDNHMDGGNLDGTGAGPQVNAHIKGVVDANTLRRQYELPVVMSIPTGVGSSPRNIAADDTTYGFSVAAWVTDTDQAYGLELAQIIIGNIINNVESNRTLESSPGAGDPVAEDVTWNSLEPDFQFSEDESMVINWCSVSFDVTSRRTRPR